MVNSYDIRLKHQSLHMSQVGSYWIILINPLNLAHSNNSLTLK